MDCLFEALLQILGEAFFGAALEFLAELIGRVVGGAWRVLTGQADPEADRSGRINLGRAILWQILGAGVGFLSLLILPHSLARAPVMRVGNLIVTPILMAGAMVLWGRLLARHERRRSAMNHFVCAYGFSLCYLLVRFGFTK